MPSAQPNQEGDKRNPFEARYRGERKPEQKQLDTESGVPNDERKAAQETHVPRGCLIPFSRKPKEKREIVPKDETDPSIQSQSTTKPGALKVGIGHCLSGIVTGAAMLTIGTNLTDFSPSFLQGFADQMYLGITQGRTSAGGSFPMTPIVFGAGFLLGAAKGQKLPHILLPFLGLRRDESGNLSSVGFFDMVKSSATVGLATPAILEGLGASVGAGYYGLMGFGAAAFMTYQIVMAAVVRVKKSIQSGSNN